MASAAAAGAEEDDDDERGDDQRGKGELQGSDAYGGWIDAAARRTRRGRAEARVGAALHAGPGGGAGRVSVPTAAGMEGVTRGVAMLIMTIMIIMIMINMINITSI